TVDYAYLTGPGFLNQVNSVNWLEAYSSGGSDVAYLLGSAGADSFSPAPTHAYPVAAGTTAPGAGFDALLASRQGGTDVALLADSAGNDILVATPGYTYLRGPGYHNQVNGFAAVQVYALRGGSDTASFYDSAGNDTFRGSGSVASLSWPAARTDASGFD